jgi:23S rRNA (adenine2030-N6)-methyltransferase
VNYRHAFHAGNFADLIKHAVLIALLQRLTAGAAGLTVIDTHAGAGLYDLEADAARRTGEGAAGIGRLLASDDSPAAFAPLRAAIEALNGGSSGRLYPGSPLLIARFLRPGDRLIACELRLDDHAALARALPRRPEIEVLQADGWRVLAARAGAARGPALVLIDPPFEHRDDAGQAVAATRRVLGRNRAAVIAIWVPIKDLAGFDAFALALAEAAGRAPVLMVEVRLRPLDDPMRLNGCAVAVVNPPEGLEATAAAAAQWIAAMLGEPGALGRASRL